MILQVDRGEVRKVSQDTQLLSQDTQLISQTLNGTKVYFTISYLDLQP